MHPSFLRQVRAGSAAGSAEGWKKRKMRPRSAESMAQTRKRSWNLLATKPRQTTSTWTRWREQPLLLRLPGDLAEQLRSQRQQRPRQQRRKTASNTTCTLRAHVACMCVNSCVSLCVCVPKGRSYAAAPRGGGRASRAASIKEGCWLRAPRQSIVDQLHMRCELHGSTGSKYHGTMVSRDERGAKDSIEAVSLPRWLRCLLLGWRGVNEPANKDHGLLRQST